MKCFPMQLYKNVFSPELDHTLAFIGFVQPASGGVLMMSEMQARWWAELCRGTCKLPSRGEMIESLNKEKVCGDFCCIFNLFKDIEVMIADLFLNFHE